VQKNEKRQKKRAAGRRNSKRSWQFAACSKRKKIKNERKSKNEI
jgi:hypothetical protein